MCENCEITCTSCDTVRAIRKANKKAFDEDPIMKLFAKRATRSQTAKIRELLQRKCNITSTKPIIGSLTTLHMFSNTQIHLYVDNIESKFNVKQKEMFTKYIQLLTQTLEKTTSWNKLIENHVIESEESLTKIMKNDILDIISNLEIKNIGFAHKPQHILISAYGFLQRSSEATPKKLGLAFHALSTNVACFEGVLGLAENVLFN